MTSIEGLSKRVHIVPLGFERDRIVRPVVGDRADVCYLLVPDVTAPDADPFPEYYSEITSALEDEGIIQHEEEVDQHDIYDVLAKTTTLIAEHGEHDVLVNVSTGTNLAAIGVAIACMTTDAEPYYVQPEEHTHDGRTQPLSSGIDEIDTVPKYPIESPTIDQLAVMKHIDDEDGGHSGVDKSDLIDYGKAEHLEFVAQSDADSDKGLYQTLDSRVLDPLDEKDHVEIRRSGRQKKVELTETGSDVLRAFEHRLT